MSALSNMSEWKKLLLLILVVMAGAFLFSIIGLAVIMSVYGHEVMFSASQSIITPQTIDALKWLQAIQSAGMFAAPAVLLAYLYSSKPWHYLGYNKTSAVNALISIAIVLFSFPAINFLSSINELIPLSDWMLINENKAEMLLNAFLANSSGTDFIINIIIICILPAFGEEMIFRSLIQKHFTKITQSVFWGIIISAFIFSAIHLQFKGFIPRFALGALLAYIYVRGGSIWLSILAHLTNNFASILVFTLMDKNLIGNQFEEIGTLSNLWIIGVASIAVVIFIATKMRKSPQSKALLND